MLLTDEMMQHIAKLEADRKKVLYLLEQGYPLNDRNGAMLFNIYYAHQRISDLRRDGYIIESVKDGADRLQYWTLISSPLFTA